MPDLYKQLLKSATSFSTDIAILPSLTKGTGTLRQTVKSRLSISCVAPGLPGTDTSLPGTDTS